VIEGKMGHLYVALGSAAAGTEIGSAIVVKARRDAVAAVGSELRREIKRSFPLAHPFIISMHESLERDYRPFRIGAKLFTAFSALALLVALVGIYSSVAYMVGQRTREFGVRIALGAHTRDVVNQVLEEGLRVVAVGVAAGIGLALLAGRLVRSLLFGVETTDVSAMLLAACSLLAVAALAALIPALRAARVDPVVALRAE
jgi:putative ABC transport system permease protein